MGAFAIAMEKKMHYINQRNLDYLPDNETELMHWLCDEKMVVPDGKGYYITNFGAIAARKLD